MEAVGGIGVILLVAAYWTGSWLQAGIGAVMFGLTLVWQRYRDRPDYSKLTPAEILARDRRNALNDGLSLSTAARVLAFDYVDAEGEFSRRTVTVTGFNREYFRGMCHLRGDYRTFRFDRVAGGLVDTATGEVMAAQMSSLA